jgi:23S rRNA pseudouridine1911/1915/1917 synthase
MVSVGSKKQDYREPVPPVAALAWPEMTEPTEVLELLDLDGEPETRSLKLTASLHAERLDKVLVTLAPEFSRSHLQHLIEGGHVRLAGQPVTASSRRVKSGQVVELELVPTAESLAFKPQAMNLAVLFEDEHLLVIDKPAGLVVHPAPGNWSGTLLNGLLHRNPAAAHLPRAGIVHRLDKDTSGVMMVGKSLQAVTSLTRDIAAREVHRRYVALVHGVPVEAAFTVDAPIARDPRVRVRMAVVPGGRPSRTDVRAVASTAGRDAVTAVTCTLHTGRTHQIRVHLASRGHPLLADLVYGGRLQLGMQRQALHAVALSLEHPISRESLSFHCPPPADFAQAWLQVASRPAG